MLWNCHCFEYLVYDEKLTIDVFAIEKTWHMVMELFD